MSRYSEGFHTVEVELYLSEPSLAAAAFDLVRTYARAHGLPDVGTIRVKLDIEFQGHTTEQHVSEFSDRLDQLWLGQVVEHTAKEYPPKE